LYCGAQNWMSLLKIVDGPFHVKKNKACSTLLATWDFIFSISINDVFLLETDVLSKQLTERDH